MDVFKSLIFNRSVLSLLMGACILVGILDVYLDNSRNKILNGTVLAIAKNDVILISQLADLYGKGLKGSRNNATAFINLLNKKLMENNSNVTIHFIRADTPQDNFQKKALAVIQSKQANHYYETSTLFGRNILRYAVPNILVSSIGTPADIIEIDLAIQQFKELSGTESLKFFWASLIMALLSTVILILFVGHLRLSAIRLERERDNVKALNDELEQRVLQRTQQLQTANESLQKTYQKLQQADIFLHNIINSMPSALIIADKNLNIIQLNDQAKQEIDQPADKIIGSSVFKSLSFLENQQAIFLQVQQDRTIHKIDSIAHKENNNVRYFDVIIYPLIEDDRGSLAIRIDDVTERMIMGIKLMQSDKMASLGVLTAGVAHEINNPINFITGAIAPLSRNITDLIDIIKKYAEICTDNDIKSELQKINSYKEGLDLEYNFKETTELLAAINDGAQRTATIVRELRAFTRTEEDTEGMKKANVEANLDSTITILRAKFKDRIEIVKQYGNVPEIDCNPGKINQVLMNILSNAIDSIENKGKIYIETLFSNDQVIIKIRDTGSGIKPEHKSKIFSPFFTTKPVAAGTGLGLSISYQIIKEHHGTIEFTSELGVGTEFVITLPLTQE